MEKIDRKFRFVATNLCNGKVYTEDNAIVFCAKDRALVAALVAYGDECEKLGCGKEHLESIDLLIDRVTAYQITVEQHIPDTETDCEIDRCIGGKGL
jgi:hypothetical protein